MNALQDEVNEAQAQLQYLQEQLADMELQKQEHEKAIGEGKRVMDVKKHSTKAEILALKSTIIFILEETRN